MTESRGVRVIKSATEDLGRKQWVISASLREIRANLRCYAGARLSSVLLVLAVGLCEPGTHRVQPVVIRLQSLDPFQERLRSA